MIIGKWINKLRELKSFYTLALLFTMFSSCQSQNNKVDNTMPMYGETEKNEKFKQIDEEFIKNSLEKFGSIDSAVNVHIDHAWRFFYNDNEELAMQRFNQAWLLNPEFPDSYFGFASLMEMKNKPKQAERFYKLGNKKDKDNTRAEICYKRIADCKEQLGDIIGTIKAYESIAFINPTNSLAYKKIGYFQMNLKDSEKAFVAYNYAINLDPGDAVTYNNRAYLNQTLKNYQLAIDDYSKAIKLNPEYISALVNRGITLMEINKFQEAKSDFEKSITLDPTAGELRRFLGLAKLSLNKSSEACDEFELAKNMGDPAATQLIEKNCKK